MTLHGFPFSNYYCMVKHALLLKDLSFNENIVYTSDAALKQISPAGKVPALTTDSGVLLSESSVLLDYLEDAYPDKPLAPSDPEARAQMRQLMRIAELYLELPARRLLPVLLAGAPLQEQTAIEVRGVLQRGADALKQLARFEPYIAGAELTLADITLRYALALPKAVGPAHLEWNVFAQVPGLADWYAMMADSDISRQLDQESKANFADFIAAISA